MLDRRQRRGAGAAVMAGDQHDVGVGLRHPGRDRADTDLGDELHVHARLRIGVLQVVNQLRQILDRVDVVVRRRRDQGDARRRVPHLGDPRVDLVARQLPAFARLGPLRHLDLDVVGVDEVLAGDAESRRGDLLDGAAPRIAVRVGDVARRILAAFAGVRLAAEAVHRDRQRFVRLLADRSVRHRAGRESLEDLLGRLDLFDRDRRAIAAEVEQPAQRPELAALVVDDVREVTVEGVLAAAGGVLELLHGLRVEEMQLAVAAPLVLAAGVEIVVVAAARREGADVPRLDFTGDDVEADAADARGGPGEVPVDECLLQADRLEDLRAAVALQRRDPHLRHDFQDALVERLDVVDRRLFVGQPRHVRENALPDHVVEGFEGEVGVDRPGAVADEQRDVVHLARVTRLDEQRAAGARPLAHQVMVDAGRRQQARNRRALLGHAAVGQDEDRVAGGDGGARLLVEAVQRPLERRAAFPRVERHRQRRRAEALERRRVDVTQLGQLIVVDDRIADVDLAARFRLGPEQVALGADRRFHRRHQLFSNRVERRVGDLREELLEIVVEQARALRQRRQRRVGAHRPQRFFPVPGHLRQEQRDVLLGVAERLLPAQHGLMIRRRQVGRVGHVLDGNEVLLQPVGVRLLARQLLLDLVVGDDPALRRVDEQDPAGMQALLEQDVLGGDVEDADLRRHDHQVVLGDVVARGPEAVAVEHRANHGAVGERDRRRPVPRLHQRRVVLVEGATGRAHPLVVLPRLGDHHQEGVGQRAARHHQQFEHVVEDRGVAAALADDRHHLLEVRAEHVRLQQRLARVHPVDVAAQRVDLAVVGDVAIRVRQRPRRKRVGAESLMHQRQRRLDPRVEQIGKHRPDLVGGQHPLVNQRVRRQADDVEEALLRRRQVEPVDRVLDALADDVELALEARIRLDRLARRRQPRAAANEELLEDRRHGDGARADGARIGRHVAPAKDELAFLDDDALEERLDLLADGRRRAAGTPARRHRRARPAA